MDGAGLQEAIFAFVFGKAERRSQQQHEQQQVSEHAVDNSKNGWERPPIKRLETRAL
jgi:hypothetical protein